MSYLQFDKKNLVNLEYSLQRELLRTNRAGAYSSTTIVGCDTRKYHGLLITRLDNLDGGKHVLLSSVDETVIQHGIEFNLGIHKYPGDHYEPRGHKYITGFESDPVPKTTYRVGGVVLTKEKLLVEKEEQILVKYTLVEAHSPTTLRFKPFLAFRNVHALSKANMYAHTKYKPIEKGIKIKLYNGYPYLHMQLSKEAEFITVPDWHYNIEYIKEQQRGYEYQEDLFVPGYFEIPIKKGESVVFSASTREENPNAFKRRFTTEKNKRIPRDSFEGCLLNSASQFIWEKPDGTDIIAGFPWYESITRQTLFALPGLMLKLGDVKTYEKILQTQVKRLKGGLFPKHTGQASNYDAADAPLFFFWTVGELETAYGKKELWRKFGPAMKKILINYRGGTRFNIHMKKNCLIHAKYDGIALSWMDGYVDGAPVTQRGGLTVEVNAAWYNAVCYALELAEAAGDNAFVKQWCKLPEKISKSFIETFWDEEKGYLADYVDGDYKDWSVRPNMIFATFLERSPLTREQKKMIISKIKSELLTPKGLRTLSPRNPLYKGTCEGNERERSLAAHQGCVYPFLIAPFIKSYLAIHKTGGLSFVKNIMEGFESEMSENCIGTLSEAYEGNPPHKGKGAISQAMNVGAVLSAISYIDNYE